MQWCILVDKRFAGLAEAVLHKVNGCWNSNNKQNKDDDLPNPAINLGENKVAARNPSGNLNDFYVDFL